jgi:hypothetical protein
MYTKASCPCGKLEHPEFTLKYSMEKTRARRRRKGGAIATERGRARKREPRSRKDRWQGRGTIGHRATEGETRGTANGVGWERAGGTAIESNMRDAHERPREGDEERSHECKQARTEKAGGRERQYMCEWQRETRVDSKGARRTVRGTAQGGVELCNVKGKHNVILLNTVTCNVKSTGNSNKHWLTLTLLANVKHKTLITLRAGVSVWTRARLP